ncbi:complex I NDUFA9 subunit family protein [Flavimaricola marinus]|uniref:dTDP-4-dehydrorhamnose reductase n=1 Tax=Flavimaricola marinus TaxID=1819565 RepID=A0A238LK85_9RHOB|nr:complex I NDUFA9 subunit family protein [Flavimaricola marinus]SMY09366.1 dTDP-4-dehydrorhamnose reductase [Flavimaricola marinus]
MSKLVTIYGGSGFVGKYITRRLAKDGWRIRVAVRNPNEAMFVRPYGAVGQVEPIFCNIRDDDSVRAALKGAEAVINCVGVLDEVGKNTFDAVQAEGPERIARIAASEGISTMVHISAIGANEDSDSEYARTKAKGESGVLAHMPSAVILRPSIVFGAEDQFFNRFAQMAQFGPILPVVGASTRFQPVYVDDVAAAAVVAVDGNASAGVYELGGPDVNTFRELMQQMLETIRRRRMIVNIPFPVARLMAGVFGVVRFLSAGLVRPPITKDQVANLAVDNVVADDARGFADLGIEPVAMEAVLPSYLWRFRQSGQYVAIKESAENLKG